MPDVTAVKALHALSLVEAVALIGDGSLSSEDYAAALLRRCREGAGLNAFISVEQDSLREAAREADRLRAEGRPLGALHGIPLALKDNIPTAALPTTGGTAALNGVRSKRNAPVVDRLLAQGALLLGKNGMHELAMGWTSDNPHFGRVGNPHAPHRLAGGSSGGSAAAVAAMMVPAAIGTDTNGSIRIPAALCGVVGFRPTVGRYPTEGIVPLSHTLDTVGPMARCVADIALLDSVMAGQPAWAPLHVLDGIRIAVSPGYFLSDLEPEVARIFGEARRRLAANGARIIEVDVPELDSLVTGIAPVLIRHESATALPGWLAVHAHGVSMARVIEDAGADLTDALQAGQRGIGTVEAQRTYYEALRRRNVLSDAMHRYFLRHDVRALMHPVVRVAAPLATGVGSRVSPAPDVQRSDGRFMSARQAFGQNVSPASIAALPSLVLRAGSTDAGLPVGIAFDAPHGCDAALLALGAALERALSTRAGHAASSIDVQPSAAP